MSSVATIAAAAQWLSDQSHAAVLTLAALAFVVEARARWRGAGAASGPVAPDHRRWLITWRTNALLLATTFALSAITAPWLAPFATQLVHANVGVLSSIDMPFALRVVIGMILLDLAGYFMHRAAHRFGWWWRLHQVHHSDISYNASTHFRQHPLTFMVSLVLHVALLWALGIPLVSWVFFTLIANLHQLWQHTQMPLPEWLDRRLRGVIVTQRFHKLHHHPDRALHDHNFGIVLPWWDYLFATAHAKDRYANCAATPTGLSYVTARNALSLWACVTAPFARSKLSDASPTQLRPAHLRKST